MDTSKLKKIIDEYKDKTVTIVPGYTFSHMQTIKLIELYYNSKYESGNTDQLGNNKPFYNIVKYRVNVTTRATDLDTKDMQIISDDPKNQNKTWLFQKKVQKWMKANNFSRFLNEFGMTRCKYGGALVKITKTKDKLTLSICDWRNIIVDPGTLNEFTPIIECHYMSPAEVWAKRDIWEHVEELLKDKKSATEDLEIFEVSGMLPNNIFEENALGYEMKHVFFAPENKGGYILFEEKLEKMNYMYLPYDQVPGRTLGVGVVEDGFQAQQWTNDIIMRQKSIIDIASKIIFQTDDDTLGNNVLLELENGDVVKLADGKSFTQVNNVPNSLPMLTEIKDQWDQQLERATSTFNAVTGESMPSGTPYRLGAILNQEASSIFDYRREEAGIFLNELFNQHIFPFLETQDTNLHTMVADFDIGELKMIDETYATQEANNMAIKSMLAGDIHSAEEYEQSYNYALQAIGETKTRRFLEVPKNYFKDMGSKVTLVITNENKNKSVQLESLSNVLGQISSNPTILQNPATAKMFNRIVELSGIDMPGLDVTQQQANTQMDAMQSPQPQQQPPQQPVDQLPQ